MFTEDVFQEMIKDGCLGTAGIYRYMLLPELPDEQVPLEELFQRGICYPDMTIDGVLHLFPSFNVVLGLLPDKKFAAMILEVSENGEMKSVATGTVDGWTLCRETCASD